MNANSAIDQVRVTGVDTAKGRFEISTDRSRLDLTAVHAYLADSYWARGIPLDVVARSIENSLCFGLYDQGGGQAGFARVVSDYATFFYLGDVYVLERYRGLGLGKSLIAAVVEHPALTGARRGILATRDAHGLYEQHGFRSLGNPARFMELHRADVYASGERGA